MKEPVVITGAGLVTPLGLSREETWQAVLRGECGIKELTALEQAEPVKKGGGQAPELPGDFSPGEAREVRYLRWALLEALVDAGAWEKLPYPPHRCGLMLGTTLHGMRAAGTFLRTGNHAALQQFLAASTLRSAAAGLAISGPAATTCSACSSSLGSIALAVTLLQQGELDLVIAGGYDTISEYAYAGFNSLRLVADGALRPFASDRQGMKLAEGYGIVVLERREDAKARGARVVATVRGWGESADAHHLTQPHPEGEGAARAIDAALVSAGIEASEIDLVAAHATGTPDNDAGEFAALRRVFGKGLSRVPVVGFKSHLGHTLGGAGACELILSAMALRDQVVPGCANVKEGESQFEGLKVSVGSGKGKVRATLNTSLGFGGANTCVVLTRDDKVSPLPGPLPEYREREMVIGPRSEYGAREVVISGIGVVLPGVTSVEALVRRMGGEDLGALKGAGTIAEEDYIGLLNARRVRRMSEYVKLTLAATALALRDAGSEDVPAFAENCSAILGSTHGSTNYSTAYYEEIVKQGIAAANPMMFAEGVPNAAAAHLSLMLSLKGACQTVIGSRTAGLDALRLATARIRSGAWDRAIVGAGEEYHQLVNVSYDHCGVYAKGEIAGPFSGGGLVAGAGAVTLVLESRESIEKRGGKARGKVQGTASGRWDSTKGTVSARVEVTARVLEELGKPEQILTSANGTWVDRVELGGIRQTGREAVVSSVYGYVAEVFSVMPMIGIAAALSSRKLPRVLGKVEGDRVRGACCERIESEFAVLCTDYTGVVSGASLSLVEP